MAGKAITRPEYRLNTAVRSVCAAVNNLIAHRPPRDHRDDLDQIGIASKCSVLVADEFQRLAQRRAGYLDDAFQGMVHLENQKDGGRDR